MPSNEHDQLVALLRSLPTPDREPAAAEMRDQMEMALAGVALPEGTGTDVVDAGGVPAEWVTSGGVEVTPGAPVVVWLHGGGYVLGSVATHRALAARLAAAARMPVLNVGYRLAPEHPFPAAVDDAVSALRWLEKEGHPPAATAVGGDSAGGGLAAACLVALRDGGHPLPAAAVLLSPWLDLTCSSAAMTRLADDDPLVAQDGLRRLAAWYLGDDGDATEPLASPVRADLTGLPPLLVQVSGSEVLLDDATAFTERAREAGVEVELDVWEGMVHVWHLFAGTVPEGAAGIEAVARWLRQRLGG